MGRLGLLHPNFSVVIIVVALFEAVGHLLLGVEVVLVRRSCSPGYAVTSSLACPEHPVSLKIVALTFAAVMCVAQAPRSVNAA